MLIHVMYMAMTAVFTGGILIIMSDILLNLTMRIVTVVTEREQAYKEKHNPFKIGHLCPVTMSMGAHSYSQALYSLDLEFAV